MKTFIIAVVCLVIGFTGAYLVFASQPDKQDKVETTEKQLYTCGMHPEIISDEPGLCPICNMKLTPKRDGTAPSGGVKIDPVTKQNMGLTTSEAAYINIGRAVNTFGKVEVAEPNLYKVTLKTKGWVKNLFVSQSGEEVFKNQPLFEIYSPEIVTAQKEYLVALSDPDNANMKKLASSVKQRLKNWDISDDQIERIEETKELSQTIIIRSPADGFVLKKDIENGSQVGPGRELYEIADLSTVWVEAQIYESDLPFVKLDQKASVVIPSLPGKTFEGTVSYLSPILDNKNQAVIRITLGNPDFSLRPEMYAEVVLNQLSDKPVLAVPRSSVINSGKRQIVYVADSSDSYQAYEIETGVIGQDDMIEIVRGLNEGDRVVTSGQFLIDSESRLSESTVHAMGNHQHEGGMSMPMNTEMSMESTPEPAGKDPYDIHTCPMPSHFHILNYGPGKCSECGMDLVPITETEHDPVYVCPMPQCGTVSEKPGDCPVCNMHLVPYPEQKEDHSAHETMTEPVSDEMGSEDPYDIHTCPMPSHFHILNYGPGKCSECGMDLVPITKTEHDPVYVCPMPQCGVVSEKPGECEHCGMTLVEYLPGGKND